MSEYSYSYIAKDEDGRQVKFSVNVDDETELEIAIREICNDNGWDENSVEDSPYAD